MDFMDEILAGSYWEHFKKAKDLAFIYPPEHERRKELEVAMNDILGQTKKPLQFLEAAPGRGTSH